MDREIPQKEIRRRKMKMALKVGGSIIAIVIIATILIRSFGSSIAESSLSLSTVERGSIELSYSASGVIVPAFEEIINSPINSKILEVYKKSGDAVDVGTPLMKLDLQEAQTDLSKAVDESLMKKCELQQLRLNNQTQLNDLKMHIKVSMMKLNQLALEVRNEKYLDSLGSGTRDKVREAEMNLRTGRLELQQLQQQYKNELLVKAADVKSKELEYNIMVKNIENIRHTLTDAQIRSPRRAVLSYINNQIGAQVAQGNRVAMVSDVHHFKVNCEIADSYSSKVVVGGKVLVKMGSRQLEGIITNVTPLSQNGMIDFSVQLNKDDDSSLHSGLKVDVYVMSNMKQNVLRIANGTYYTGMPGDYDMFVMTSGKQLEKRTVKLGESSYEYVEVLGGVKAGDRVVTSDMSNYKDKNKLRITK